MQDLLSLHPLITPPVFRIALTERARLLELLRSSADLRLTLVDAPAGYGKTWLLASRYAELRASGARVVWLGANDSTTPELLTLLVHAFARAGLEVGHLETLADSGFSEVPVASAVRALVSMLAIAGVPVTIIIDDLHRLDRAAVRDVLAKLISDAPRNAHFLCGGADCSALPRGSLRVRGELREIGIDELRFSDDEAATLLTALNDSQRARLLARTEGWPVALQLARLWIAERPERSELLDAFSGRTSEVAEYLTERVLHDLPPQLQSLLFEIAVLDTLNPELVDAVTGDRNAWTQLLEAGQLEHFLVPLDNERYWFRLHHLLLDYLRAHMRGQDIDACGLHSRAASWFERNGRVREAVRHAVLADDVPRAAALIERLGGWEVVLFGGTSLMQALVAALPAERLEEFPRVQMFRAYVAIKTGDVLGGRRIYDRVARDHVPETGRDPALTRDLLILGNIMRTYSDEPPADRSVEDLLREYENLPSTDTVGRAALVNSAAVLAHRVGSLSKALDVSQRAVGAMRCIGSIIGVNYCMLHLGLAQLHCGQRREAESTLREAASLAEENFGADSGLKALAEVHLALALHARGEIAEVVELLGRSLPQVEAVDGWPGIYAEAYEVAVLNALARGDRTAAAQWLERMAATASRRGLATLVECATALRARTTIVQLQLSQELRDESSSARRTMSTAEQSLKWQRGAWRAAPHTWRSHHIGGLALVHAAIARGETAEAENLLDDLDESAQAGARLRHLRSLAVLRAVIQLQGGDAVTSISSLMPHLDACVQEDDTQLLADLGPVLLPLLQNALNWSRRHGGSSRVRHVLSTTMTELARAVTVRESPDALTERELEVLVELARGAANKVIARNLQMTENTVKFHLKRVFQKLKIQSRAEALQAARTRGLLS